MIAEAKPAWPPAIGDAEPEPARAAWVRRGGVIMVAGPDGSGKTTLAHGLAQSVFADVPVLQVHHRRGVGRLPGRQPRGPTTEPHRHAPYPTVVSLGKTFYLFIDFLYGWLATIRPFVRSGGWVILQRDWWDLLVDPKRYRLRSMPRLGRFLGRLLPQPDLTLILEADPDIISERKAELSLEELARQRAAWRAVRPPGDACAYVDAAQPAREVLRRAASELARRMCEQGGSRHASGWVAIPRVRDARWMLPRDSGSVARASLGVYQPVTMKGRIGWELARSLSSLGAFRLLPRGAAPPRAVRELVDPYVPAGGSVAVARTNHAGRYVTLILGTDGSPVAVAKIATDDEGRSALAREASNLEQLGGLLPRPLSAPQILGRADGALVVEAVRWQARWRPWRMPEAVAFALGAFSRARSAADADGTRSGLSHGDVAPWNLLKTSDRWVLVDWEDAGVRRPPFHDLMHFLAQSSTLLGRPSPRELVDGIAGKRGWIGRAVAAYARGAQLSAPDGWSYLLAYLQASIDDPDRKRLLEELTGYRNVGASLAPSSSSLAVRAVKRKPHTTHSPARTRGALPMRKEWVLVTSDGPQLRDSLIAVRALAQAGYRPAVAVSCGFSLASSSRYCLRRIDIPHHEDPGYVPAIQAELKRLPYLTVLPASEVALLALGVSVPDLVDKAKVEELGRAVGIPSPPGRRFSSSEELLAAANELEYPVIVKPAVHRYHASRVESPAGLAAAVLKDGAVMVQPYLNDALHAVSGVLWRGQLVAAVHERWFRIWRFHSGVATAAETVEPDVDLEDRLTRLMAGYDGYFHAQFAGPYLLDLNLRVHTSHPLAVAAGANLVGIYCDLLRGEDVATVRGRPGVFFRWIEGDVRHVAKAMRLGSMGPREAFAALRPRRGTVHSTESLSDPGPMLSRLGYLGRQVAARALGRRD